MLAYAGMTVVLLPLQVVIPAKVGTQSKNCVRSTLFLDPAVKPRDDSNFVGMTVVTSV